MSAIAGSRSLDQRWKIKAVRGAVADGAAVLDLIGTLRSASIVASSALSAPRRALASACSVSSWRRRASSSLMAPTRTALAPDASVAGASPPDLVLFTPEFGYATFFAAASNSS